MTEEESLQYELTQLPMSLFDKNQRMRKANKAVLGKYLKGLTNNEEWPTGISLVIGGGWLLHQGSFKSGQTYGEIAQNYFNFISKYKKEVTAVFDGYSASPKDQDHGQRSN